MRNLQHVIAAVDFSGHGLDGARWVARHLEPESVVLLHALHLPRPPSFLEGRWGDLAEIERSARVGALSRLERLARDLQRETGVKVETRVEVGAPTDQIVGIAEDVDAGLIVLGAHANRPGRWDRLGSTAERVLHASRLPVLLTGGELPPPTRLLAALDGSAITAGIMLWLRAIVEQTGAEAIALHVIDNTMDTTLRAIMDPHRPGDEADLRQRAQAWLETRLGEANLEGAETQVVLGDPAIEILAAAGRLGADLIIMGTRGAGLAKGLMIGGVARLVIRGARCPVLLLPTPE